MEVQDLLQEDPLQEDQMVERMDDIAEVMAPIDDFGIDDDEIERELRELEAEMEQVYVQCAYVYVCVCGRWMGGVWAVDGRWMGGGWEVWNGNGVRSETDMCDFVPGDLVFCMCVMFAVCVCV